MQYWYNLSTGMVEEGAQSDYSQLMGPYDSKDEAQRALEIAASKTKQYDEAEEQYRND